MRAQDYYDPVWSGRGCREDERVDVGRGGGSCHTDCDCPLCAPYCSTSGFCQNHQRAGRTFCSLASASTGPASTSTPACPPLPGEPAPPGCNKRFVEDSADIPCWDDTDCPSSGICGNNVCIFLDWTYGVGYGSYARSSSFTR